MTNYNKLHLYGNVREGVSIHETPIHEKMRTFAITIGILVETNGHTAGTQLYFHTHTDDIISTRNKIITMLGGKGKMRGQSQYCIENSNREELSYIKAQMHDHFDDLIVELWYYGYIEHIANMFDDINPWFAPNALQVMTDYIYR